MFEILYQLINVFFSLGVKYVNEALVKIDQNKKDGVPEDNVNEESVLRKLLRIDRKYAILMTMDMIFAGIDTTASTSAIFLYHMAHNQDKQAILLEEIVKALPDVDSPLTEETLNHMPYLKACMKESMRVQPLIPGHLRASGQDIILNGYQVPKMVRDTRYSWLCADHFRIEYLHRFSYSNFPHRWI